MLYGRTSNNTYETYSERYINPADINVIAGYGIEVYAYGLDAPINMLFTEDGNLIVGESGITTGVPRVLQLVNNNFEVLVEGFREPLTGINYLNGYLYVSHRGSITRITNKGLKQNIISGLPSNGDYYNGRVVFGPDRRKIYFGQGTITNSGVVGLDNRWVINHPQMCDYPGDYITLNGQNYQTMNNMNEVSLGEIILTGAFSPYRNPNAPNETRKANMIPSGSIMMANLDGTKLEQYAWGFRNPLNIKFDENGLLYAANRGYDNRGSRPVANAPDEFFAVSRGLWYGWPDYAGGEPVNSQRFAPEGAGNPELLLKNIPNIPQIPVATFSTNSNIMGFDFDYYNFGPYGDAYIAEYGSIDFEESHESVSYAGAGHRVARIDMKLRAVSTIAINKSGFPSYISEEGGFGRPTDIVFGPDGAMYVLDMGVEDTNNPNILLPYTGVIWRIFKQ